MFSKMRLILITFLLFKTTNCLITCDKACVKCKEAFTVAEMKKVYCNMCNECNAKINNHKDFENKESSMSITNKEEILPIQSIEDFGSITNLIFNKDNFMNDKHLDTEGEKYNKNDGTRTINFNGEFIEVNEDDKKSLPHWKTGEENFRQNIESETDKAKIMESVLHKNNDEAFPWHTKKNHIDDPYRLKHNLGGGGEKIRQIKTISTPKLMFRQNMENYIPEKGKFDYRTVRNRRQTVDISRGGQYHGERNLRHEIEPPEEFSPPCPPPPPCQYDQLRPRLRPNMMVHFSTAVSCPNPQPCPRAAAPPCCFPMCPTPCRPFQTTISPQNNYPDYDYISRGTIKPFDNNHMSKADNMPDLYPDRPFTKSTQFVRVNDVYRQRNGELNYNSVANHRKLGNGARLYQNDQINQHITAPINFHTNKKGITEISPVKIHKDIDKQQNKIRDNKKVLDMKSIAKAIAKKSWTKLDPSEILRKNLNMVKGQGMMIAIPRNKLG